MSPNAAAEGTPRDVPAPEDPVGSSAIATKDVVVMTADRVDRTCHDALKVHYARHPDVAVVLVAGRVAPHDIVAVAPYGVAAVVSAAELRAERGLLERVKALVADGGHRLPSGVGSRLRTAAAGSVRQVLGRPGILLKPAEVDVVVLVAEGLTRAGIARRLGRGAEHVRYTLKNALERLGVERRAAAVAYAAREGLLPHLPDQEAR
ncbi:DNA-binding NarL/FixJ family response regulator [Streptomyces sp. KhCrAH-43]|uniref:helix-turn-helix transcriptional regulator n=1 Tax=unclassified Streptomyces TaxID=2593676 RepID=UPI0003716C13|nr:MULTISPECIES: LuxR C-terminal-related transcriptional regulator [unclassified Streptomyces]MYS33609.1 DNA-binding response regulator [Streptomyces sp. SID4920]MYX63798.1 DNA-binding response regulator [Streptomyces sp. SID8373]RAJ52850.1 DNA-binding NarL/FixJ family response regulator [Streptomyces sp. KhCrAH-43]